MKRKAIIAGNLPHWGGEFQATLNEGGFPARSAFSKLNCFADLSLPLAWLPPHACPYQKAKKKQKRLNRCVLNGIFAAKHNLQCHGSAGCRGGCKKTQKGKKDWLLYKQALAARKRAREAARRRREPHLTARHARAGPEPLEHLPETDGRPGERRLAREELQRTRRREADFDASFEAAEAANAQARTEDA